MLSGQPRNLSVFDNALEYYESGEQYDFFSTPAIPYIVNNEDELNIPPFINSSYRGEFADASCAS
jgi:hypothetical protein